MNPKMTAKDAAGFLGVSTKQVHKYLMQEQLPFAKSQSSVHFGYATARKLFNLDSYPKAIAFQIVKGGTGKTSLACAFAIRANLYGLKVLCIDLDQQGNLTHTFSVDADNLPVMIDILAEGYSYQESITRVYPGLDLLSSRIENALIDDVIKLKKMPLDTVYKIPIQKLKQKYDLIVIDCPPNLGQSVAAVTLAVDLVVAPVVPENFALSGLKVTCNTVKEIESNYNTKIPIGIILNKYDARTILSQEALQTLANHKSYQGNLLKTYVHVSQEFPNAIYKGQTIYDTVKPTTAKKDIDDLTKELLGIANQYSLTGHKFAQSSSRLEESLV